MAKTRGRFALLTSIVTIVFASLTALADDCPSVRLDRPGGSMEKIPTKDQRDLGICYSYTAATIFDAWAKSRLNENDRPPHSTSPVYLATLYQLSNKQPIACPKFAQDGKTLEPLINAGLTCQALNVLATSGTCSEEELEQHLRKNVGERESLASIREKIRKLEKDIARDRDSFARFKAKKTNLSAASRQSILDNFRDDFKRDENEMKDLKDQERAELAKPYTSDMKAFRTLYRDDWLQPYCSPEARAKSSCAPTSCNDFGAESVKVPLVQEIIDQMARLSLADLKKNLDQLACEKNKWTFPASTTCRPSCSYEKDQSPLVIQAKLTSALTAPNALPTEVAFCSAVIMPLDQYRVWKDIEKIPAPKGDSWITHPKCGWHAALIIGQEKNPVTGKCQYRVRNSHGAECGQSTCNDLRCKCESKTGDILIDRDLLLSNTDGITTVSQTGVCK